MMNPRQTEADTAKEITVQVTGSPAREHYLVAIGASAGGLEAIHDFFDNLTENTNLSFVIIQHLSRDYKSLLVELVAKHTHMQVFEAGQDMEVRPDCIYVIPPGKQMTISGNRLQLARMPADRAPNMAIDTFLFSMAREYGHRAVAVILSGTGTDGTRGIDAIREGGGLVLVQDPESARFDGMPRSAIATGQMDMVLPPSLMPVEIVSHVETPAEVPVEGAKISEDLLEELFGVIYKNTGCDFHQYKLPTLLRRIARRMGLLKLTVIGDYLKLLKESPEECRLLSKDFFIGVTRFFRDPAAFEALEELVLPALIDGKQPGDTLKVWVAACSTGEEAYSLAILIDRYLKQQGRSLKVKIFATDIDEQSIETAAKGAYPATISRQLPADILEAYFTKEEDRYLVHPELRQQIVFARHNIIQDPPFIRNDLISCRNLLIYMNPSLQRKILTTFHFSLTAPGFLLLGSSETLTYLKEPMEEIDRKWKIYRKAEKAATGTMMLFEAGVYARKPADQPVRQLRGALQDKVITSGLQADFREALSQDLGYAAVYIDRNFEVKEATGDFRRYLNLPEKSLALHLLKMLPADLSIAVGRCVRKAWKEDRKTISKNITVRNGQARRSVSLVVKPGPSQDPKAFTLVVFGENAVNQKAAFAEPEGEDAAQDERNEYIADLRAELQDTRISLQLAIEGLETANEELQSTNEELLSSNEELQSSNEELQSLNEELHTLNSEHQLKIAELIELNDDLNNYFRSTDIGQVFVDSNLRIRKFNPAAVRMINLIDSDIGRPIEHISTNLKQDLQEDISHVLQTGDVVEKELQLANGQNTLMRILPYLRQDKKTDGIVITFVDITTLNELNSIIRAVFNSSQSAIMVFRAVRNESFAVTDFSTVTVNHEAGLLLAQDERRLTGRSFRDLFPAALQDTLFDACVRVVQQHSMQQLEFEAEWPGARGYYELCAVRMNDGVTITFTDVTGKRTAEEQLRRNYNELLTTREELRRLNAGLEEKIRERTRALAASEERFRLISKATNDAIWDWNLVNNSMWVSDSYYAQFGEPEGRQPLTFTTWLDRIHPDDRPAVRDYLHNAINTGQSQWSSEYRYLRPDGAYARILDRGYLMQDEWGTPYRMLGSMLDVTNLRSAQVEAETNREQRLFLADTVPLLVWTASRGGDIDFINQPFEQYTGYTLADLNGGAWPDIFPDEALSRVTATWQEAMQQEQDFAFEVRVRRHDGEARWHLLQARVRRSEAGGVLMWVGTLTDIHDQKLQHQILEQKVAERTESLQVMNQALETSNEDLQRFASVTSHDLKEPLRKISMFGNMLRDRYGEQLEDKAMAFMDRIIMASERMTRLINNLLAYSRLSARLESEPVSLEDTIAEILADFELLIQEKDAVIDVGALPVIEASPGQMRHLFQNLISNALKFSRPDQSPLIRIRGERVGAKDFEAAPDSGGAWVRIVVTDNGIGFDEKYLDKIFTIFQQLHTRSEYEGTGIGLAICKRITDRHNGLITAASQPGEGARFIIILPLEQPRNDLA